MPHIEAARQVAEVIMGRFPAIVQSASRLGESSCPARWEEVRVPLSHHLRAGATNANICTKLQPTLRALLAHHDGHADCQI